MARAADGSVIIDTGIDTEGFEKGSDKIKKAVRSLVDTTDKVAKEFNGLERESENLLIKIAKAQRQANEGFKNQSQIDRAKEKLIELEQQYNSIAERMQVFGEAALTNNAGLKAALQNLKSALASKDVERIAQARADLHGIYREGGQFKGSETKEYQDLAENIELAGSALERLKADQDAAKPKVDDTSRWNEWGAVLKTAGQAALKTASNIAKISFEKITLGIKSAISGLDQFGKKISQSFLKIASGIKGTISNIGTFLGKINLLKSQSGQSRKLINQLAGALTSFRRILVSKIKETLISGAFNAAKEDLQKLASYSKEFDLAMSNLKNSAASLSANLAVTFGNLIMAIEPILTRIINAISNAITYINAFFGMLSGKNAIIVAKKQTGSYAAGLNDAAKAAGNAADKQEDLNEALYGFDEINKRNDSSSGSYDNGSGSGTVGTGAGGAGDIFTTMPIDSLLPDSIAEFARKLKEAINKEDWEGVGKLLAKGLNKIVDKVDDWNKNSFRPAAVKWAGNIARILNGLFADWDAEKTGKTLAGLFNTAVEAIDTFIDTFDWNTAGTRIGDLMTGLFEEWDAAKTGETIADAANGIIDALDGAVTAFPWKTAGKKFAEAANTMFDIWDSEKTGTTLGKTFNGVLTTVDTTITDFKWAEAGRKLSDGLDSLVEEVDWTLLGTTIGNAIDGFWTGVQAWAESNKWALYGASVANGFNALIQTNFIQTKASGIAEVFNGLLTSINTAITTFNWTSLGQQLAGGVDTLFSKVNWKLFGTTIGNAIKNFWTMIDTWANSAAWGDYGKDIADGLNSLLETHAISTKAQAIKDVLNGLITTFVNFVNNINWEELQKELTSALTSVLNIDVGSFLAGAGTLIFNLIHAIAQAFEDNKDKFVEFGESIGNALASLDWGQLLSDVATIIIDVIGGLLKGLAQSDAGGWIGLIAGGLALIKIGKGVFDVFGSNIAKSIWESIKTKTAEGTSGDIVGEITKNLSGAGTTLGEGLGETTGSAFKSSLGTVLQTTAETGAVVAGATAIWHAYKGYTDLLIESDPAWQAEKQRVNDALQSTNLLGDSYNLLAERLGGIKTAQELYTGEVSNTDTSIDAILGVLESYERQSNGVVDVLGAMSGGLADNNGEWLLLAQYLGYSGTMADGMASSLKGMYGELYDAYEAEKAAAESTNGLTTSMENAETQIGSTSESLDDFGSAAGDTSEDVQDAMDAITDSVGDAGEDIEKSTGNTVDEVTKGIEKGGEVIKSKCEDAAQGAYDGLNSKSEETVKIMPDIIDDSADRVKTETPKLKAETEAAAEEARAGLDSKTENSVGISSDIINRMSNNFEAGKELIKGVTESLAGTEYDGLNSKTEDSSGISTKIAGNLANGFALGEAAVKSSAESIAGGAYEGIDSKTEDVEGVGENFSTNMKDGIYGQFSVICTMAQLVANGIYNLFDNKAGEMRTPGANFISNLDSGMHTRSSWVNSTVRNIGDSIYKTLNSVQNNTNVAGRNAIIGFHNGMVAKENIVYNTARTIANNAVNIINSALQIGSPSRVMRRIGEYTDEGFALGIEDGERSLLRTVSGMASNVIAAADTSGAELGLSTDGMLSDFEMVAKELSDIVMIFAAIEKAITNLGGLNMPGIMSGTVAPVRTVLDSGRVASGSGADMSGMMSSMETQNSLLRQQNELLQELIDSTGGVIDVSSILSGVSRANRRAGKAVL